jgi:ubiquinone/menaquinone biosynthesis C-methylase UbiE
MQAVPIALTVVLSSFSAFAQQFGGAENLAPYIPTPQLLVERMLEAGHVKPGDVVYDLGSGDGRIVITAAQKFGAKAVGVEIRADLCRIATEKIKSLGLDDRVRMVQGNVMRVDLSPADVVTLYLATDANEMLRPNLEKYLKNGARVVSHEYAVPGWKPNVVDKDQERHGHTIYLYLMPPKKK